MVNLNTYDNSLVGLAIGRENDKWYVQTTDISPNTYLSEGIEENLVNVHHALAIAKKYRDKYKMKIVVWAKARVNVEGYGIGTVFDNDLSNDYPIIVEFDKSEHPSEEIGYFNIDQITFI